jgi:hypothetical protein
MYLMDELVRPGRECKTCGESRRSCMSKGARHIDGLQMICKACKRAQYLSWAAAHSADRQAYNAQWHAAHPEKSREYGRRHTAATVARRRSRLAAATCAPAFDLSSVPSGCTHAGPFHLDHIFPASRGGCANLHNLQWLCAPCNQSKSASLPPVGTGCPECWE